MLNIFAVMHRLMSSRTVTISDWRRICVGNFSGSEERRRGNASSGAGSFV